MIYRAAEPEDGAFILAVVAAAFGRSDEADLVDRLTADGDAALSLVAQDGDRIVGHILFSRMKAPFPALALAPVSVAPDRQREGIGGALIRAGLDLATAHGWRGVFVLGDPAYYGRFGFGVDAAWGFDSPYAGPHLMALGLGGPLPVRAGAIAHAPAFGALS